MLYLLIFLFGLIIGSFLNVVIYRLPQELHHSWEEDARETLGLPPAAKTETIRLNRPRRSCCPTCGATLLWYENIPLVSYFLQRGRCRHCDGKISPQYPLVEGGTALIFVGLYGVYGLTPMLSAAFFLAASLIVLAVIDWEWQLLPDVLTLPLLWLGLILSFFAVIPVAFEASFLGAVCGYLLFWAVFHLYRALTRKEGLGYGDFKLFAALGAWFGLQALPFLLILATVIGLFLALLTRAQKSEPMPFGPALASSGLFALLFAPWAQAWFTPLFGGV